MTIGDYVVPKGDGHVYQIKDIQGTTLIVEDGHQKLYTVDQSKVWVYTHRS